LEDDDDDDEDDDEDDDDEEDVDKREEDDDDGDEDEDDDEEDEEDEEPRLRGRPMLRAADGDRAGVPSAELLIFESPSAGCVGCLGNTNLSTTSSST
jgi:hypothetical protein